MGCKFYFGAEKKKKKETKWKRKKNCKGSGRTEMKRMEGEGGKSDFIGREQRKIARRGIFWEKAAGKALRNLLECVDGEFSTARPRFWRKRASKFREHVRKT